jgi:DNA-binding response OmpR family regulator
MNNVYKIAILDEKFSFELSTNYKFHNCDLFFKIYKKPLKFLCNLKNGEIDLLIIDYNSPYFSCVEIMGYMEKNHPQIPKIITKSKEENISMKFALELGADDLFVKPFDNKILYMRIISILRNKDRNNFNAIDNHSVGPYTLCTFTRSVKLLEK